MQFQIEVIQTTEKKNVKNARGGVYNAVEVVYKKDGKVEAKDFPDWANETVYPALLALKAGDIRTVTTKKDANGFWKWLSVSASNEAVSGTEGNFDTQAVSKQSQPPFSSSSDNAKTTTGKVLGSNYPTADERSAVQRYIIRQSSISNAIATFGKMKIPEREEVVELARFYEAYVLGPQ